MISFKIIPKIDINIIIPLIKLLPNASDEATIAKRLSEMIHQNYECVGVYDKEKLIGCAGLWIQTRHYAGRSLEPDHVIILPAYRDQEIGTKLGKYLVAYAKEKGCDAAELNCYIPNIAGQKFWQKLGYQKIGYHYIITNLND